MIIRLFFIFSLFSLSATAQPALPFSSIPDYPEEYTAATVSARMIDAAGFRFYWATDGLEETDLAYRPHGDSRSSRETIEHIYSLTQFIYNTHFSKPIRPVDISDKSFPELRKEILQMLLEVRTFLTSENPDLRTLEISFPQGSLPYWNLVNGPISDMIYHTGQVILMRRASGNPVRPGVSVLMGTVNN